jgi:predicted dehydrogenase
MRILLIGLGGIGQRHLRNIRTVLGPGVDILAHRVRRHTELVTPELTADPERNVEREYSIKVFSDLDEALSHRPSIALICNPSSMHASVGLACLRAGCDIFVEKPLSHSLDGIADLIRVAADQNRIAMVGYQLRFHPCIKRLGEIIQSGVLGNLLAVRSIIGEYLPKWHPYEDYRQMYASRADLGGGVVLSQIHEFDYLYSLFGLPSRIYAIGGHWSDLEIDVEDTASILMNFRMNDRPLPIHLHQDYLQWPPSRQCEVIGDHGRVIMDLRALTVTLFRLECDAPEVHSFPAFERNQLFLDELNHFLECVKTRRKPMVDLADGLQSLRIALAVKESMKTRLPVELHESNGKVN